MRTLSLWFTGPSSAEIKESMVNPPQKNEVLVHTLFSGISSGTEMVVYRGETAEEDAKDISLPTIEGSFNFPIKYGYSNVGKVIAAGPEAVYFKPGDIVFVHAPHQKEYVVPEDLAFKLPENILPEEGVFLANLETSVNCLLDSDFYLGENVVIFGQGVVGLLLTQVFRLAGAGKIIAVDKIARRRNISIAVGADYSFSPDEDDFIAKILALTDEKGADLAIEASGNPEALNLALKTVAFQCTVMVISWYGIRPAILYLGKEFHRKRLKLQSSQVSHINPGLYPRWDKKRRMDIALRLLPRLQLKELISHVYPFYKAPEVFQEIDVNPEDVVQVILKY
jgi:2-desacetyl-2-hydroxyethyl bacteriochlorophyllide A dehydrogenase